jgi:pyruvate-formate lyase-activating enzyme
MKLKIQKFSLLDSPSSCSILFFPGCNLDCIYCYNLDLIRNKEYQSDLTIDESIDYIHSLKHLGSNGEFLTVDWIVFSGGEPSLYPEELKVLSEEAHKVGLKVAIYTNGTKPNGIRGLNLDFVNIDYKWREYGPGQLDSIFETIGICKEVEYLRINTTLLRTVHTYEYLKDMRDLLLPIYDPGIIIPRHSINTLPKRCWTFESFFNDGDKIKTLGKVSSTESLSFKEIQELCEKLNVR